MLVTDLKVIILFCILTNNNKKEIKDFINLTHLVFLILIIISKATEAKNYPNVFLSMKSFSLSLFCSNTGNPLPPSLYLYFVKTLYQIPSHIINISYSIDFSSSSLLQTFSRRYVIRIQMIIYG